MRQDNDGKIGEAQVKSGITVVECRCQAMLVLRQPLDTETALGEILQELPSRRSQLPQRLRALQLLTWILWLTRWMFRPSP
jgi:hypothetical protein